MKVWNELLCASLLYLTLGACGSDRSDRPLTPPPSAAHTIEAPDAATLATWNVIALTTTAAGPFSPPRESRAMAMVSAAVFDAVNSITWQYEPYVARVAADRGASIVAAVSVAAHDVLVALYPAQISSLDASRDSALATIADGAAKRAGMAVGRKIAGDVLARRARDRSAEPPRFVPGTRIGDWVPTPPGFVAALEPTWGVVKPFVLDSGSQFRPGVPPTVGGAAYVRDYVEIARVGSKDSTARTTAQTETALFWVSTAPQLWNQVVRQLTVARGLDVSTSARAYLLLNLAGADGMIAAWDAKYAYDQWRPVTAIRDRRDDGSLTTISDTTWTPLITTPPFPDYPAGHTTYGGAAEQVLSAVFGERPGPISITSPTAGGATHRYQSFHEISEEIVDARVWGGVHWRTSSNVGRARGRRIGDVAAASAPKRLH
jgi:hypothetical protein